MSKTEERYINLMRGDCLELMKSIPAESVDLVFTDPPYNIGKADWDKIENYIEWFGQVITGFVRVLKDNGTLIFWHNDIEQAARIMVWIEQNTPLKFSSWGLWHKPNFRSLAWKNTNGGCTQRSWFNVFEFFLVYINPAAGAGGNNTGLDCIYSNPECFKPLKDWYKYELERLGIGKPEIYAKYTEVTGKKPYMPDRHYFKDSQFEIPTEAVYNAVYIPLGFNKSYKELRQSYEELRPCFNIVDGEQYSNYFTADKQNCLVNQLHPCLKPANIIRKLIQTHSRDGAVVLDPFMGSGSTGVVCVETGRNFIGIEIGEHYFDIARKRIEQAQEDLRG